MASLFSIADEVMMSLGLSHDDARINRIAMAYYVLIAVDKLNARRLTKDSSTDIRQASDRLEQFIVDLQLNDPLIPWPCMYFNLPAELYDLPFDGGLAWVRYHRTNLPPHCPPSIAGRPFSHTTLGALSNLYEQAYKRPDPRRPYVARDKYRVYVFGVNDLISKLHIGLFCTLPDMADMDPDAPLPLPPDAISDVRRMVIDSARLALLIPERLANDGRDLTEPVRTEKQVSINDGINIVDTP